MIECKELCAFYGNTQVLDRISFSLSPGELVAVVGKNASGKTTFLRSLLGTMKKSTGETTLDGVSITSLSRLDIARKIAYLPQHIEPTSLSVLETVLMGRYPHLSYPRIFRSRDREIAQEAMAKLGLIAYRDTPVCELSGGFARRCALASALATESDYLFLDEPTTFLDIASTLDFLATLHHLARDGKGILVVLHDLPLALRFADRIAVLDGTRLVALDTPDALFQSGLLNQIFDITLYRAENGVYYIG